METQKRSEPNTKYTVCLQKSEFRSVLQRNPSESDGMTKILSLKEQKGIEMSVFNNFEISFTKGNIQQLEEITQNIFDNTNLEYEYYINENLDGTMSLEVDIYTKNNYECSDFRQMFQKLCHNIVLRNPEYNFMGRHIYDLASEDSTKYILSFYKNRELTFYQAEVLDDINSIDSSMYRLIFKNEIFEEKEEHFFDDYFFDASNETDNIFFDVLECYDLKEYPEV